MVAALSAVHWMIVIIVLIVLFGASKLPDIAKNLGKSAKILKKELNDLQDDDEPKDAITDGDDK